METRNTAVSKPVEYVTAECTNCGEEVFIDDEAENADKLPRGINVVLSGGEAMTTERTSFTAAAKSHRIPRVLVKIFAREGKSPDTRRSYLCPACARSAYGSEVNE